MIYLHFVIDYVYNEEEIFKKDKANSSRSVNPYYILYPYTAGNKEQQKEKGKIKKILEEEKICDINSLRNLLSCRGYIPYMHRKEEFLSLPELKNEERMEREEYGFYKILK